LIAYFITIFIAAPAALITGLGMSPALSTRFKRLSRVLSIQTARSLHFLVFVWFLIFIVTHVLFVFTTGLRANLNHIYGGRDDDSWIGFSVFALSMVVLIVGWVAATPLTLRHPRVVQRVGFALIGPVQRLFEHVDSTARRLHRARHLAVFLAQRETPRLRDSTLPCSPITSRVAGFGSAGWSTTPSTSRSRSCARCRITNRSRSTSASKAGRASPSGAACRCRRSSTSFARSPRRSGSCFTPLLTVPEGGIYYDVHAIEQMRYKLTMLAYDMNGQPLPPDHGAPLRLRNETQLGFKQVKWIKGLEFVADFADIGGGYGGYHQDHEFFGYRQSI
jgi:hypothetical protein